MFTTYIEVIILATSETFPKGKCVIRDATCIADPDTFLSESGSDLITVRIRILPHTNFVFFQQQKGL
jgi:hypothetical protein